MENLKEKLNQFDKPTITFFFIMLAYHMLANINYGDDVSYFQNVLAGSQDYIGDTIRFSFERYNTWSSRTIIEIFVIYLAHLPHIVCRIADTMIWMLLYSSMINLLDIKTEKMRCSLTILLLFFPFKYTGTAGWICTSLNYVWPLVFGCYYFTVLKQNIEKTLISQYKYLVSFLLLSYAVNAEQMAFITFFVVFTALIYIGVKYRHIDKFCIISILCLVV